MRKLFTLICGLFFMLCSFEAMAQKAISGVVTSTDGSPLQGASVLLKGTTYGALTDENGAFSLEVPGDDAVLIIAFLGKATDEITVGSQTTFNVSLQDDALALDEVIVTGYGSQRKGDITAAISSIGSKEVEVAPVTSIEQAMQGRAAGVLISSVSGQPGAGLNVQIRGATSITASSKPLYVVDGIPMTQDNNSRLFTGGYEFNSLADLNPNDIESIEILKDASAAAIYGSRGANGVVLITTKRGKEGKAKINLDVYTGFQGPTNVIDMMNSREFIEMMDEAAENDGFGPGYFSTNGPAFNRIGDPSDPDLIDTDWYGEILRDDAPITSYTLSAAGGTSKAQYYLSANYFDQEGFQKGTAFERLSFRANLDFQASEKLKVGVQGFVSRSDNTSTIGDNSLYGVMINALAADPTMPIFEDDGTYANPFSYYSWWAFENPRAVTDIYSRSTFTTRFLGTMYAEYEIIPDLKFRTSWSADFQFLRDNLFYPSSTQQAIRGGIQGEGQYSNAENLTWLNENTITYTTSFADKHNLTALAGFTMQESMTDRADINGQNFPNDFLGNLALAANITDGNTDGTSWGLLSYLGRVNYSFDNRYYATVSARIDGSSRFGTDNQYGVFPSGSVAWRISSEPFMEGADFINDLKVRASYGLTGNQDGIENFTSRALWSSSDAYNGLGGAAPSIMGNGALGWESTSQLDLGLDISLFNGRVGFVFDYFKKTTTDLLLASNVPGYTGFTTVTRNIGEVENEGLEFSLNTVNIDKGGFTWRTSFNISTIENEVTKLEQGEQLQGTTHILREGLPLGSYYLINWEGVDPETGNSVYTDVNGDGAINGDDSMVPMDGDKVLSIWPDFFGGLNNSFSYKGFDVSVFLQFSQGNYVWNHGRYAAEQVGWSFDFGGFYLPYGNNTKRVIDGRWKQPGDQTDIPRASLGRVLNPDGSVTAIAQNWQEDSDQWLEDASYLRIKNVEVAYNLPKTWVSAIGLNTVRVYFRGQNLATWTDYLGVDPEVGSNGDSLLQPGDDFGGLGQAKTYIFGINVGF
ncbi:MAG: TonB-dependent receptor [Bacteroidota bacterium]